MQNPTPRSATADADLVMEDSCSSVSALAVLGGAAVIAALSALLILLATGLGFAFVSPWSDEPLTVTKFTVATALWLILIQWIPSAFGGYLAGRLRGRWIGVDGDETYFRDTAQGVIAWAVAALIGMGIVLCASFTGATASSAAALMMNKGTDAFGRAGLNPLSYYVDSMLRGNRTGTPVDRETRDEIALILTKGLIKSGPMRDEDRSYLVQVISTRTGMDAAAAGPLVDDTIAQIKNAANDARKATASTLIFTFLSMLIGAFTAGLMAAMGGRHRDRVVLAPVGRMGK